jgi:hypothetical protein
MLLCHWDISILNNQKLTTVTKFTLETHLLRRIFQFLTIIYCKITFIHVFSHYAVTLSRNATTA